MLVKNTPLDALQHLAVAVYEQALSLLKFTVCQHRDGPTEKQ
jgi:hypothetical protein